MSLHWLPPRASCNLGGPWAVEVQGFMNRYVSFPPSFCFIVWIQNFVNSYMSGKNWSNTTASQNVLCYSIFFFYKSCSGLITPGKCFIMWLCLSRTVFRKGAEFLSTFNFFFLWRVELGIVFSLGRGYEYFYSLVSEYWEKKRNSIETFFSNWWCGKR